MDERDIERVATAIQRAMDFSSGGLYDIEYTIIHPVTRQERIVRAKGKAWFNEDKLAYRFNGTLEDITKDVQIQELLQARELSIPGVDLPSWSSRCRNAPKNSKRRMKS